MVKKVPDNQMESIDDECYLFEPPDADSAWQKLYLLRKYFAPEFVDFDNVNPERPSLFVGNHSLYGIDSVIFFAALYKLTGIYLRGFGDRNLFKIPFFGDFLKSCGHCPGSREACTDLMQDGENILLFPGGQREVLKHKGETYKLTWKNRYGFVRLAITHGYTITPFAAVGPDESFDIVMDAKDYMATPLGKFLKATGIAGKFLRSGDEIPPMVRGIGLTPIPRPEKYYFKIGKPIDMQPYQNQLISDSESTLKDARDVVEEAVYQLISDLKEYRQEHNQGGLWRRFLNRL
jgi:1-acyl-sn-glycerol-3-phosphate acyltransferase